MSPRADRQGRRQLAIDCCVPKGFQGVIAMSPRGHPQGVIRSIPTCSGLLCPHGVGVAVMVDAVSPPVPCPHQCPTRIRGCIEGYRRLRESIRIWRPMLGSLETSNPSTIKFARRRAPSAYETGFSGVTASDRPADLEVVV